jgi:hypothetical protein
MAEVLADAAQYIAIILVALLALGQVVMLAASGA